MLGYDAVVVGGGHNGLTAAAFLAKAGVRTVVLESRDVTGGAAITERPWGDDFRITALSYVMSLMPSHIIDALDLPRHGYRVHPMGPAYVAFPDGRSLLYDEDDPRRLAEEVAKFSPRDAAALPRYDAWLKGLADVLGPLLTVVPPRLGSKRPRDLAEAARLAWRVRGLDVRGVADITRLLTCSVGDILREWFESPELMGLLAVNGVIGTWAGPEAPGTAYVMAHHSIGDVGDGTVGKWGFPEGGMGAVADAIRASAEEAGARVRTGARVARIATRNGRATGVVLEGGEEIAAYVVVAATHPQITFLQHLDPADLPADFVADIERWRSRSGVVKINLALAELPDFTADPGTTTAPHHTGAIELVHSLDYLERAFQDARAGRAAARPFVDACIPSTLDPTLCPPGTHVMSLFTQWVPHTWADAPHEAELDAYADRVIDGFAELAPNFKSSILHRQVLGPYEMATTYGLVGGNIFHGELSLDQLFHMRPAPGYADYRTPIDGLYQCSSATHAGGGVCGIPGWQAARAVIADQRRGFLAKLRR